MATSTSGITRDKLKTFPEINQTKARKRKTLASEDRVEIAGFSLTLNNPGQRPPNQPHQNKKGNRHSIRPFLLHVSNSIHSERQKRSTTSRRIAEEDEGENRGNISLTTKKVRRKNISNLKVTNCDSAIRGKRMGGDLFVCRKLGDAMFSGFFRRSKGRAGADLPADMFEVTAVGGLLGREPSRGLQACNDWGLNAGRGF